MKNSWDPVWKEIFEKSEWGKYPEISVVRFIASNYYKKEREKIKVLDVGCGTGNHVWYLSREGFQTYGIDGSKEAIEKAKLRIKRNNLKADLRIGDIIKLPYKNNFFDCVIDSSCIQHNKKENILKITKEVKRVLKKGGKFLSIMVSKDNSLTKNYGTITFSKKKDIENYWKEFKKLNINYTEYSRNDQEEIHKSWIIEGENEF
jgi:ubiquinone/menaquinone biosynthesis C-methylase UbiE